MRRLLPLLLFASLAGCSCQRAPTPCGATPTHYPVLLPGSPDLI